MALHSDIYIYLSTYVAKRSRDNESKILKPIHCSSKVDALVFFSPFRSVERTEIVIYWRMFRVGKAIQSIYFKKKKKYR